MKKKFVIAVSSAFLMLGLAGTAQAAPGAISGRRAGHPSAPSCRPRGPRAPRRTATTPGAPRRSPTRRSWPHTAAERSVPRRVPSLTRRDPSASHFVLTVIRRCPRHPLSFAAVGRLPRWLVPDLPRRTPCASAPSWPRSPSPRSCSGSLPRAALASRPSSPSTSAPVSCPRASRSTTAATSS